jgi:hypothetical protein
MHCWPSPELRSRALGMLVAKTGEEFSTKSCHVCGDAPVTVNPSKADVACAAIKPYFASILNVVLTVRLHAHQCVILPEKSVNILEIIQIHRPNHEATHPSSLGKIDLGCERLRIVIADPIVLYSPY